MNPLFVAACFLVAGFVLAPTAEATPLVGSCGDPRVPFAFADVLCGNPSTGMCFVYVAGSCRL